MRKVTLFFCTVLFILSVAVFGTCARTCAARTENAGTGVEANTGAGSSKTYDVVIASGRLYDGSGRASYVANIGIKDGHIAAIGKLEADADGVVDAQGLAVAPGFINMLSWANDSLIEDGRSQSDIRQGVTLEIMGEGWSMGPLNEKMKREMTRSQGDIKFSIEWTTLGEYLEYLVNKGVSTNIASFVGATTVRAYVIGYEDRH
ncbi:MAG: hypothetical protein ACYTBX_16350, partial [Planctomycetota bacterium]